jgi:hypothetical protein
MTYPGGPHTTMAWVLDDILLFIIVCSEEAREPDRSIDVPTLILFEDSLGESLISSPTLFPVSVYVSGNVRE